MTISIERHIAGISYNYPQLYLKMGCYLCSISNGTPHLFEHKDARWLAPEEIDWVYWLPADVLVVNALKMQRIV